MRTKVCTTCHVEKELNAFGVEKKGKYGRRSKCRECRSLTEKQDPEYRRKHYQENRSHIKRWRRRYYWNNADKLRQDRLDYYYENKEAHNEYGKKYRWRRRKVDPMFRLSDNISGGIWYAIKENKAGCHWEDLVGYSLDDLKQSLEQKFSDGMDWDNYGDWHVDHIRPKASFSYTKHTDQDFKECWALDNLQPLWAEDNLRKGAKYK